MVHWPHGWRTTFKHGTKTPYCLGLDMENNSGVIRIRPINLQNVPNPTIYIDVPADAEVVDQLIAELEKLKT